MLVLKTTVQTQSGQRDADLELDFTSKAWTIKNGKYLLPGVLFSERGVFERKPWGVIWLLDGPGSSTRTAMIIHDAPVDENDGRHAGGGGRVYDPANPALKDAQINWKFLRRTSLPSSPSGAQSAIRTRFLAVCAEIFPQKTSGLIHFTSQRRKAGSKVTNCGVFPGMVFGRIPVIPPTQRGAFRVKDMYLTTPMTMWDLFAQAVDKEKKPPKNTWIPFTGGNRPLPGDIYILKNETTEDFQHVGVIVDPSGDKWTTSDGGQGDGYQGGWVKRSFEPSGMMTGEFGNKARLKGWVDLDNLYEVAKPVFPADLK